VAQGADGTARPGRERGEGEAPDRDLRPLEPVRVDVLGDVLQRRGVADLTGGTAMGVRPPAVCRVAAAGPGGSRTPAAPGRADARRVRCAADHAEFRAAGSNPVARAAPLRGRPGHAFSGSAAPRLSNSAAPLFCAPRIEIRTR